MATFRYIALDAQGRQKVGSIPADNRSAAMDLVMNQGLSPLSLEEQGDGKVVTTTAAQGASPKLSSSAIERFTRELANLLAAGLSLARSLSLLKREQSNPGAKMIFDAIYEDVVGGAPLADAMARWPRAFSTVYVAMVRAGETGGFIAPVLQQIADFRTRERDLRGKVIASLTYPMVLAFFATIVTVVLLTFFIPQMTGMFKELGGNLPTLTRIIVAMSDFLMKYGIYILAVIAVVVLSVVRAAGTPSGKRTIERVILATPGIGSFTAQFALVRFCRMLGTLLSSGVPLVAALKVAKEAIGNQTLSDAVEHSIEEVRRGSSLAKTLQSNKQLFPTAVTEMITVAEETSRLDKELMRLSISYESDLDRQLRTLVSLVEPVLLLVMASVIGTIVIGMLLPIFSLQELVH